ncbi:hypothetical protein L202_05132 [Cryptococcus amylolentus CBS 6039]|uniref:Uncharacterized protein n=1 Tax=Cryptococcus amylolentus CBS 6039 TaxID=1295533 RepID=A0A1E3HRH7_9TREE|nr:hypothetical protein L202_05132 [Cryptococcus amylolentus CBS 6039]ODN78051.1 hypothetical protein L202_05132 [Cryptococcus amylolentus CBS 6039]
MLPLRQTAAARRVFSRAPRLNHRPFTRSSPALLSKHSSLQLQPRPTARTYVSFTNPSAFSFSSSSQAASGDLSELAKKDDTVLTRLRAGEGQLVDEGYYDPDDKFNGPPVSYDPFRYPAELQPHLPLAKLNAPSGRPYTPNTTANILCRNHSTTKQLCHETRNGEIFSMETFVIVYESANENDLVQSLEKGQTFRGRVVFADDRITHLAFDGHLFSVSHDPNGVHGTASLKEVVAVLAETEREMLGIDPKTAADILALHVDERRNGITHDSSPTPSPASAVPSSSEFSPSNDPDELALQQHLESLSNSRKQALAESRSVLERVRASLDHLVVDYDPEEGRQIFGSDDFKYPAQHHSLPLHTIDPPSSYPYTPNTSARILSPDDFELHELLNLSEDGKVVTYDGIVRIFEREDDGDLVTQMNKGKTLRARLIFADGRTTHLATDGHVFSLSDQGEGLDETVRLERVVGLLGKAEREMLKIEPTLFESIYTQHIAEYTERHFKAHRRLTANDPPSPEELENTHLASVPTIAEWNLDPYTLINKLPIWAACALDSHPTVLSSPAPVIGTDEVVEKIEKGEGLEFFVERAVAEHGLPTDLDLDGKGRWCEWIVRVRSQSETAQNREIRAFIATIHDDGLRAKTISIGGTFVNLELLDGGGYVVGEEEEVSVGDLAGL